MSREIEFRYFYNGKMYEVGKIEFFEDGSIHVNDELVGGVLMQWTGLKDKHGEKIFEGDVLSPSLRVVEFCTDVRLKSVYETYGGAGFYTRAYKGTGRPEEIGVFSFGVTQAEVSEVIGNIYSNPDLLEQSK